MTSLKVLLNKLRTLTENIATCVALAPYPVTAIQGKKKKLDKDTDGKKNA